MANQETPPDLEVARREVVECGGLQFEATFRAPGGATLRVSVVADSEVPELLRFDDFIEAPHYHVPSSSDPIPFDQALGEPLTWFISQIRDNLAELLTEAGFAQVLSDVDLDAVRQHVGSIRKAMESVVPDGYVRVPGVGLQRSSA